MKSNEWYVIGIRKEKDMTIQNYVEEITFRNHHYKEFKNSTLQFTDDLRFALRIKSREVADCLGFVTQQSLPNLKVDVLLFDESWFKL